MVKPVPDGYSNLTPYLYVSDARRAIDFYRTVFGAKELMRLDGDGGKIGHAELQVGASKIMLADEHPEMDVRGPHAYGGTAVSFLLYVEDVDRVFADALRAGARQLRAVENKFYGDRAGMVEDPFGHQWMIATHVEDVTPEEMRRRAAQQSQA